ncbi:unnamed protein product [Urochloa decumbens]|uniref:DUF1618 domain-containing protein n=1 Tax=Urochloa decumbens TaxID=240449 RepID=A0ABC9BA29_9POAL
MSGHGQSRRRSSDASSSGRSIPTSDHHRRRFKRTSGTSSAGSPASRRPASWVILNLAGFPGDRTTSAVSRTSAGEAISASLELVEPPGTSVLTLDMPELASPPAASRELNMQILAADRDVVLFGMTFHPKRSPCDGADDYFVYRASTSTDPSPRPSLSLLPVHYEEHQFYHRYPVQHRLFYTGILSCSGSKDSSSLPPFIIAELDKEYGYGRQADVDLCRLLVYRSVSNEWEVFKNVHVHGTDGGRALRYWTTDAVVPYRRRFLIWVDYYRGMIVADMSSQSEKNLLPPTLRYVPLPLGTVPDNDPDDREHGRGIPRSSRSLCATRSGIKFVSVDTQHVSSFGVGLAHMLTWNQTFRITVWSLRDGDYTWRKGATMYEQEFLDAIDSQGRLFPHVQPEFPVVNMENPDAVCFQLRKESKDDSDSSDEKETAWMVEVDMKKKVLLAFTDYSNGTSLSSGDQEDAIGAARIESLEGIFISSELPHYLDPGQACKKTRQ